MRVFRDDKRYTMMRNSALLRVVTYALLSLSTFGLAKLHASRVGDYDLSSSPRFWWVCGYLALLAAVSYSLGFPDRPLFESRLLSAFVATSLSSTLLAVAQTVLGQFSIPRFVLIGSIPTNAVLLWLSARMSTTAVRDSAARERILLIGSESDSSAVRTDAEQYSHAPFSIVGAINCADTNYVDQVRAAGQELAPTMIVCSANAMSDLELCTELTRLHSNGIRIRNLASFYDLQIGKIPIREIEASMLFFDIQEVHQSLYHRASRAVDVCFGVLGCIVLILVMPLVLLGNAIGNRGPLFYTQDRVGKNSRTFRIIKFRSMRPDGKNSQWTAKNDPRVTRFGRLLRVTHLDELPQSMNILRGDLSLVGPRPEQPQYVETLVESIPHYSSRHLVRPGLTGWAQVNYPYGADEKDAYEKLQYDLWYLRHQSLLLDLRIVARTTRHVLGFGGR
jgi:exopolysaccharide biosynthesis polyprenyl glycosylphosphotransferase